MTILHRSHASRRAIVRTAWRLKEHVPGAFRAVSAKNKRPWPDRRFEGIPRNEADAVQETRLVEIEFAGSPLAVRIAGNPVTIGGEHRPTGRVSD